MLNFFQSPLFLEVFPPVRFNLAAGNNLYLMNKANAMCIAPGSGPLHIVGNVHTGIATPVIERVGVIPMFD